MVDDEDVVVDVVSRYLKRDGFEVRTATSGTEGLSQVDAFRPDLVVLDLMLPGLNGLDVFREIDPHVPVIMLTAKDDEADRVLGLELGADDYVTKPFSPRELVARVRTVLRRVEGRPPVPGPRVVFDGLAIDPARREVHVDGEPVQLTVKEFDLLHFMARSPGQVFRRDQIFEHVWQDLPLGDSATVTVHVRRLREKIEEDPSDPRWVQTVWGVGYRFMPR